MITDLNYSWKWAANASNEEFLTQFKNDSKNLINKLCSECYQDRSKSLKALVDPILEKIAIIFLETADDYLYIGGFFKSLIHWEGNSHHHVDALLGVYLRAIYQGSNEFAKTTSQLMHSNLAEKADKKFLSDISLRSEEEKRFLMLCQEGKIEDIQKMIEGGIDVNTSDPLGFTPLHIASLRGRIELVKLLLASERLEIDKTNLQDDTALSLAAFKMQRDICALLIQRNASIEIANLQGFTPFLTGCVGGNLSVIELLMENGASIESKTQQGKNGADIALDWNHDEILDFLQKKGVFPCIVANVLGKAIEEYDFDKIELLIAEGNLKQIRSPDHEIFMNWATEVGHVSLLKALNNNDAKEALNNDDSIEVINNKDSNELLEQDRFLRGNDKDFDDFFECIKQGTMRIDDKIKGKTMLHVSAILGNIEQAERLFNSGANINLQDALGNTPLMVAIQIGDLFIANYLIDKGAILLPINNNGKDALSIAQENEFVEIAAKIIDNLFKNL